MKTKLNNQHSLEDFKRMPARHNIAFIQSRMQSKITWQAKKQENVTKSQEKRQSSDANQELIQMLEWSDRHFEGFKGAIRTPVHEVEVKVNTPKTSGKKVLSRETEIIKEGPTGNFISEK